MVVWIGGFTVQFTLGINYDSPTRWTDPNYGGPCVLIVLYGFSDSIYQSYLYWLMVAMSNDPALLSRYAGFYKAIQSAGAAITFGIEAANIPVRWECLVCWVLLVVSFPFIYLVARSVTETNITSDDTSSTDFSDAEKGDTLSTIISDAEKDETFFHHLL